MPTYTLNDLLFAKGVNEPLRQAVLQLIRQRDDIEAVAKRLALDLECVLLDRSSNQWWDSSHESLQAYRDLMDRLYPQDYVSPLGKD